jgi:hypothetical protein
MLIISYCYQLRLAGENYLYFDDINDAIYYQKNNSTVNEGIRKIKILKDTMSDELFLLNEITLTKLKYHIVS